MTFLVDVTAFTFMALFVARLGADNLKPDFLIRSLENGDVLAAANAGEEIQAAIGAGWLDIVSPDGNFNSLKDSPVFHWSDAEMEAYLKQHNLPNEWDYFDPAKADEKRECGLHAAWGQKAMGSGV